MAEISAEMLAIYEAWSGGTRAERDQITDEAIAKLSPREQRLVREAAVMGYVLGRVSGLRSDDEHPKDTWVYRYVVCGCAKNADRYPHVAGVAAP